MHRDSGRAAAVAGAAGKADVPLEAWTPDHKLGRERGVPIRLVELEAGGRLGSRAFKLLFIRSGSAIIELGDTKFACFAPAALCLNETESPLAAGAFAGSALLFDPSVLNGSFSEESIRRGLRGPTGLDVSIELDLYWAVPYIERDSSGPRPLPLGPLPARRLERWFARLGSELESQGCAHWRAWARSYLSEILFALASAYHARPGSGVSSAPEIEDSEEPAARAVAFLHEAYASSDLRVEALASRFATNRTSLQRDFRRLTGYGVAEYLRRLRLSVARELIEGSAKTISEVALEVGFLELSGFERAFARAYGLSPKLYRKSIPR